jgi:hypothetical protein
MKKRLTLLFAAALLLAAFPAHSQEDAAPALEEVEVPKAWESGAGFGMDFSQLFQLNPRQGAGQNRVGIGGAVNIFAKYKKDRLAWDNLGIMQFGVQRLGSGVITQGSTEKVPFQKAIDELRLNSKVGYKVGANSKFFYAVDFTLLSQLTPTYKGTEQFPGFFLSDVSADGQNPLSKIFSPATTTFSVGIDYKPNDKLSIFYSPIGSKFVMVLSDIIARQGVHGNPVEGDRGPDGLFLPENTKNVDSQLGSILRVNYANKFLSDRMAFTSGLILFSNYLNEPQNVDMDWTNELALQIAKGLQLSLTANVFYDHDMRMLVTDNKAPNGIKVDVDGNPVTARRVSLTQQILLKYNVVF